MSSFFDEDFPQEDEEEECDEYNECRCDACGQTFFVPSDSVPDTCPSCGSDFDNC